MPINLGDIAILNINGADCCCIISESSKSEAVNILSSRKTEHCKK